MGKLDGKVALVTGGAFGNGRAMALRLAQEGAGVVLGDVDEGRLEESATLVRQQGGRVVTQRCDPLITGTVGAEGVAGAFAALGDPERHAKILVEPWR